MSSCGSLHAGQPSTRSLLYGFDARRVGLPLRGHAIHQPADLEQLPATWGGASESSRRACQEPGSRRTSVTSVGSRAPQAGSSEGRFHLKVESKGEELLSKVQQFRGGLLQPGWSSKHPTPTRPRARRWAGPSTTHRTCRWVQQACLTPLGGAQRLTQQQRVELHQPGVTIDLLWILMGVACYMLQSL